jgi:MarR family transcriptional regulator, organic hydroperoxide resistance regulator
VPQQSRDTAPPARANTADLKLLFGELVRLETQLWDAVEARLVADHRLTLPKFEFMQVMSRVPRCRVHDIASEISITVGGASKIVDRIEADGLCARRANPGDRRSSIIELTAAGRQTLATATVSFEDELQRQLGTSLSDRALVQLSKTITKLRIAMREVDAAEESA